MFTSTGGVVIEPVIGRAAIQLILAPGLQGNLAQLAAGRPLVIDYYASRLRGVAFGDLILWFGEPAREPCYVELAPIEGVAVLSERHLVGLLGGAILREAGPPWHRHPAVSLARPEDWIDFLDRHPSRRR
jgi:hypothetical protein